MVVTAKKYNGIEDEKDRGDEVIYIPMSVPAPKHPTIDVYVNDEYGDLMPPLIPDVDEYSYDEYANEEEDYCIYDIRNPQVYRSSPTHPYDEFFNSARKKLKIV